MGIEDADGKAKLTLNDADRLGEIRIVRYHDRLVKITPKRVEHEVGGKIYVGALSSVFMTRICFGGGVSTAIHVDFARKIHCESLGSGLSPELAGRFVGAEARRVFDYRPP